MTISRRAKISGASAEREPCGCASGSAAAARGAAAAACAAGGPAARTSAAPIGAPASGAGGNDRLSSTGVAIESGRPACVRTAGAGVAAALGGVSGALASRGGVVRLTR